MSEQQPTGAGTGKPPVDADAASADDSQVTRAAASETTSEASDGAGAELAANQTTNAELRDELDSIRAIGER